MRQLSFISHPFENILKNCGILFQGIERCVAVYYDYLKHQTVIAEAYPNGAITYLQNTPSSVVTKSRSRVKPNDWVRVDDVPFELKEENLTQLTLNDELSARVLVLRFPNPSDKKSDVLYIYFNEHFGGFKLTTSDDALTGNAKQIIQTLAYNSVKLMTEQAQNDFEIWETLQKSTQIQYTEQQKLKSEVAELQQKHLSDWKKAVQYVLSKITEEKITISEAAIEKISRLPIDFNQLEELLNHALLLAKNKWSAISSETISISEHEIVPQIITISNTSAQENSENNQYGRYAGTVAFLDKYEQAAKELKALGKSLTGGNIGAQLSPSVSPAAISDVLKKHRKKILTLLKDYPEKWPIIRNEFRPIKNIIVRNDDNDVSKIA